MDFLDINKPLNFGKMGFYGVIDKLFCQVNPVEKREVLVDYRLPFSCSEN